MKAKLISSVHGEFSFAEAATVGRGGDATITIDSSVVSTEHAKIAFDSERSAYVLEDLGSLNGTKLDGVAVERPEPLGRLHHICLGGSEDFIFQTLDVEDAGELDTIEVPPVGQTQVGGEVPALPEALRDSARSGEADEGGTRVEKAHVPLPAALQGEAKGSKKKSEPKRKSKPKGKAKAMAGETAASSFVLEFTIESKISRFELQEGENMVGRSKTADIRLDFRDLSRRHAVVTVAGTKVSIRDEGSRNHTFVGGTQVEGEVEVAVGSEIVFGRLRARLIAGGGEGESA